MSIIIFVHGTFAGRESGQVRWWQPESQFSKLLSSLLASGESQIEIVPMSWQADNREIDRWAGADQLLRMLMEFEKRGKPYFIIGHSHGGSVISHALMIAAGRRINLVCMKGAATVGTPFLQVGPPRRVFSHFSAVTKTMYLTAAIFFMLLSYLIVAGFYFGDQSIAEEIIRPIVLFQIFPMLLFFASVTHWLFWFFHRRSISRYSDRNERLCDAEFSSRFHCLWDWRDEAIGGLLLALRNEVRLFDTAALRSLLSPVVVLIAAGVLVSATLAGSFWESIGNSVWAVFGVDCEIATSQRHKSTPGIMFFYLVDCLSDNVTSDLFMKDALFFSFLPIIVVLVLLGAVAISLIALFAIGPAASGWLNAAVSYQLRNVAFGITAPGLSAKAVSVSPRWYRQSSAALPAELSERLSARSDAALLRSIGEVRAKLVRLAAMPDDVSVVTSLNELWVWDELIHTSYFEDTLFVKFLAFGICNSGGFKPTESFNQDAEYDLVRRLWHEMKEKSNEQQNPAP